jgi:hypothetical protein
MYTVPTLELAGKNKGEYPKEYVKWKGKMFFVAKAVTEYQNTGITPLDMYRVFFLCNAMHVGINFGTVKSAKLLAIHLETFPYEGDYSQKSLATFYSPIMKEWKEKRSIGILPYKGE